MHVPAVSTTKSGMKRDLWLWASSQYKEQAFVVFPNKAYKTVVVIRGNSQPDFHAVMAKVDWSEVRVFRMARKHGFAHEKVHLIIRLKWKWNKRLCWLCSHLWSSVRTTASWITVALVCFIHTFTTGTNAWNDWYCTGGSLVVTSGYTLSRSNTSCSVVGNLCCFDSVNGHLVC